MADNSPVTFTSEAWGFQGSPTYDPYEGFAYNRRRP